jgi:hypothetical protein
MSERREPVYKFSEQQVAAKSSLARQFIETRHKLNAEVERSRQLPGQALLQP